MPRRLLVVLLLAAVAGPAIWLALLRPSAAATRAAPAPGALLVAPEHRRALPDIVGSSLTPPPALLALRARDGRPALIDVWASWCVPCKEEARMLASLARAYRGKIRFLGIDVEDTRGDAGAFEHKYGVTYPSIFDPSANMASKLGIFGLPTAYLVDHHGRIAATLAGKQTRGALARRFERLLGESGGA